MHIRIYVNLLALESLSELEEFTYEGYGVRFKRLKYGWTDLIGGVFDYCASCVARFNQV